jgi:hypothetical protein
MRSACAPACCRFSVLLIGGFAAVGAVLRRRTPMRFA